MSGRWYKRCGADFIHGTIGLSLEEKGAYSLCLDLIYDRGGPIPDDARWLAGICGVSLRKWQLLRDRLILVGKLSFEGGFLSSPSTDHWGLGGEREPLTPAQRAYVFARKGFSCTYCGDADGPFHIDHIHPVVLGGSNDLENLTVACRPCNLSKGAKTLDEWGGRQ